MFIGPGSWSFRLPTSHLRHRCKGQHPWSSGKIRFLVGCGNPRFIPRPWIHSNSKLPAPSPQSILYFCENPQVSTGMNGNMQQHTYCQWARKKVCVQASLSLSFMLFKTNIWNATWLPQSESDWQIRAQYLSPVVVRRAHSGVAVSPFGTSLGQLPVLSHLGLQKSPDSPCTFTACSSDSQPVLGLP